MLEYSEEFMKIKEKLDNIEQRLRNYFIGEAPNSYNNSLKYDTAVHSWLQYTPYRGRVL